MKQSLVEDSCGSSEWGFDLILWQLLNILALFVWIALSVFALLQLRHRHMPETMRWLWVALILLMPIAGALAFLVVRPGMSRSPSHSSQ